MECREDPIYEYEISSEESSDPKIEILKTRLQSSRVFYYISADAPLFARQKSARLQHFPTPPVTFTHDCR